MAEIKSVEHYVVTRILDLEAQVAEREAQVAEKQAQIDALRDQNRELRKVLDDLASHFKIRTNWRGNVKYIWFDGPLQNYDPWFDELVKLFGLTEKKEEKDNG